MDRYFFNLLLISFVFVSHSACSSNGNQDSDMEVKKEDVVYQIEVKNEDMVSDSGAKNEQISKENTWKKTPTVDEFGKKTGRYTIGAEFEGFLRNSATTGDKLIVRAQVSDSTIYLSFFEYGRIPGNLPERKFIQVDVRKFSGDVVEVGQFFYSNYMVDIGYLPGSNSLHGGDGNTKDGQLLEILLSESEPITLRVQLSRVDRFQTTEYIFDMDNIGLAELL
jgi:hypothetical protein